MATPHPFPDGLDRRPRASERLRRMVFNIIAIGAITGAPLATVSLWLLLTNPVVAGEVAGSGSVLSVARLLIITVGKAIAAVLAYL